VSRERLVVRFFAAFGNAENHVFVGIFAGIREGERLFEMYKIFSPCIFLYASRDHLGLSVLFVCKGISRG